MYTTLETQLSASFWGVPAERWNFGGQYAPIFCRLVNGSLISGAGFVPLGIAGLTLQASESRGLETFAAGFQPTLKPCQAYMGKSGGGSFR